MATGILAHGKNWELPVPSNPADIQLSIESKMTAEAAGVLFTRGLGDILIFSTGHTAGPQYPTEATEMRTEMYTHFTEDEIPLEATRLEEDSYDTDGNLKIVHERFEEYGIDDLILLTLGFHDPRVRKLADIQGVPVRAAYKSDYVLRERYDDKKHLYARQVLAQARARRSAKPLVRAAGSYGLEAAGWTLLTVDPHGQHVAKLATRKIRHQG